MLETAIMPPVDIHTRGTPNRKASSLISDNGARETRTGVNKTQARDNDGRKPYNHVPTKLKRRGRIL